MKEMTRGSLFRPGSLLCLLLIMLVTGSVSAQDITLETEAEYYQPYGFNNTGGLWIQIVSANSASGGAQVTGVDITGEWIELQLTFPEDRCYESALFGKVMSGHETQWRVRILGAGPGGTDLTADYNMVGTGLA